MSCRFVLWRARRGDSERHLNELQRRARAAAISADPRGGRETRLSARIPQQQGRRGENGEIPAQRLGAQQRSPAREACLLTCRGGRGLGTEARASVLGGRESGKKSAAAEEARDFVLPLCFVAHKGRGFRAPPKRTPETGASCGYHRGPQRRTRAVVISAHLRDRQETLRLLLPPPKSLCASTGHYPHHPSREPVQPATARLP